MFAIRSASLSSRSKSCWWMGHPEIAGGHTLDVRQIQAAMQSLPFIVAELAGMLILSCCTSTRPSLKRNAA